MGAWGVLAFDNDDANDWAAEFVENADGLSLVEKAIAAVEQEASGYLEQGAACEALAACEVLARLQGRPGYVNAYTTKVEAWVAAHPLVPSGELLARAVRAIGRITGDDSELRELWDESGADEWLAAVADLSERVLSKSAGSETARSGGTGRRFELIDGAHAKYWEINCADDTVTVRFGRIGTRGQTQTKQFLAESLAMEHSAKLILDKRRKGYKEIGQPDSPVGPATAPSPLAVQTPPDGPLLIGAVQLPVGRRIAHDESYGKAEVTGPVLWMTSEPVPNAGTTVAACRREVATPWTAFLANDESPGDGRPWNSGEFVPADTREIARFSPVEVLAEMWNSSMPGTDGELEELAEVTAPFGFTFPGLAAPGAAPPKAAAATGLRRLFAKPTAPPNPWSVVDARPSMRIGVVAAQRPADIITTLGWPGAVNYRDDTAPLSAVLRSWEDRFGASVVEVGFDTLLLVVERPPQTLDHALAVAAEHYAFCCDIIMQGVGSLEAYAPLLVGRHLWDFWWD